MRVFLDFEASSLGEDSYPIEVGWVFEDGREEGMLITPAPGWTDWDVEAERVHGITRAQLTSEGLPHDEVCAKLIALFAEHDVYASAPSRDGHWLSMLLRASGEPRRRLRLTDTDDAFWEAARQRFGPDVPLDTIVAAIADARAAARANRVEHRAVADARREWRIWQRILTG